MQIDIVTPDKNVYSGEVSSAVFPGSDGSFGVLKDHAPMIATLGKGEIKVEEGNQEKTFEIGGGVVEVLNNKIIVLAESAA